MKTRLSTGKTKTLACINPLDRARFWSACETPRSRQSLHVITVEWKTMCSITTPKVPPAVSATDGKPCSESGSELNSVRESHRYSVLRALTQHAVIEL